MHTPSEFSGSISRRDALRLGAMGAAGLALAGRAPLRATAAPAASRPARAKSIVHVWLWGGPSHLCTFDPKPDAGRDYTGPYDKPIDTNVDGIRLGQMLPRLAKMADKYSLLRGMTHGNNGHETAAYLMLAGWPGGGELVYPAFGAVVSHELGYRAGYQGLIPPYVTVTRPQGRFSEAGFLGPRYQPFATGGDPSRTPFLVEGVVAEGLSDTRQANRRELLQQLDGLARTMAGHPLVDQVERSREGAYSLILGEERKTFDLATEPDEVRQAYGRNTFGQSCLVARKLVEAGVPFITVNAQGWDTHKQHFDMMQRKLPELDRGVSALITELDERGLLDSTIVCCGGEFGRTPKIDWEAPWNGGRGHYGRAFSYLMAGGGFKGGQVVGATCGRGERVIERPILPWDLIASMYEQMGIDWRGTLPTPDGKRVPISPLGDPSTNVETGGLLREIMS